MEVSELIGPDLDYWFTVAGGNVDTSFDALMEKHGVDLGMVISPSGEDENIWKCTVFSKEHKDIEGDKVVSILHQFGGTARVAVYRGVIASVFGNEVKVRVNDIR